MVFCSAKHGEFQTLLCHLEKISGKFPLFPEKKIIGVRCKISQSIKTPWDMLNLDTYSKLRVRSKISNVIRGICDNLWFDT